MNKRGVGYIGITTVELFILLIVFGILIFVTAKVDTSDEINSIKNRDMALADLVSSYEDRIGICPLLDLVSIRDSVGVCTASDCRALLDVKIALEKARKIAKERGYDLLVTSAYRNIQHQAKLYRIYELGGEVVAAKPSCNAPHVTGRALDVRLVDANTLELLEGMSETTDLANMEIGKRKELEDIMCEAGFVRFSGEYWHFEYDTDKAIAAKNKGMCTYG